MIDDTDAKIVNILQDNGRTSNAEIARQVGLAPSAVFERIRKLEERGVVEGYAARVAPREVGLGLLAFVFVRTDERVGGKRAAAHLAAIPEVQEVHQVAGEDCVLVKVRAADTNDLARLLREQIGAVRSVKSTRTTIVLDTVKETARLPVANGTQERSTNG
jgi:Lrp/AsnC family leucine-responsive transcriptional regulator